jgi:hypothetical protein
MQAGMPNVIGIIYNEGIILSVGAGFHSRLLCFCTALRSIAQKIF